MEMPVQCVNCNELVELNDCRESRLSKRLMCDNCYNIEEEVREKLIQIREIQDMLDNYDESIKGQRWTYKKELKTLKNEILNMGYDLNNLYI